MEKYSVSEVIEQAVQTEKLGAIFYEKAAKKFEDRKELRKLFETLSAKELEHQKIFTEMKKRVRDEQAEGWEEVSLYLRAIVESAFFLGKGKSLTSIGGVKSVLDAVNHALGFEKETLLYYLGIRDAIRKKKVINAIIGEEKSHIIALNKLKRRLAK